MDVDKETLDAVRDNILLIKRHEASWWSFFFGVLGLALMLAALWFNREQPKRDRVAEAIQEHLVGSQYIAVGPF
jgi:hypothetical protein